MRGIEKENSIRRQSCTFLFGIIKSIWNWFGKTQFAISFFLYERADERFPLLNILKAVFCAGRIWDISFRTEKVP
jgi:hypothetical protein